MSLHNFSGDQNSKLTARGAAALLREPFDRYSTSDSSVVPHLSPIFIWLVYYGIDD